MRRSFSCCSWYLRVAAAWLTILAVAPAVRAQEAPVLGPSIPIDVPEETPESDPVPAIVSHPETDTCRLSLHANFLSHRHPAFRSPCHVVTSHRQHAPD